MLCDYKFGDESAEEIRDHFSEMLDHEIQIEDLEIAEEVNTACMTSSVNSEASLTNTSEEQQEQPKKNHRSENSAKHRCDRSTSCCSACCGHLLPLLQ